MKKTTIAALAIAALCGTSALAQTTGTPVLKNRIDSLNYAFGLANGDGIKMYYLYNDSTGERYQSLMKGIAEGMKVNPEYAELIGIGRNIGQSLKEQSANGLLGNEDLVTDIELIKQGLINGLTGYNQMSAMEAQSYLNTDAILTVAKAAHCDAIHPGYGFLSENAEFADECEKNGITWIGPSGDVIRTMGNKAAARELMKSAGVPVVPGSDGSVKDVADAKRIADEIGYPVLIKAAAGGGGRGMRKVFDPEQFEDLFEEARAEARACFNDDEMYLEKLVLNPHHIFIHRSRHADIHKRPEIFPFLVIVLPGFQIAVLNGILLELMEKIVKSLLLFLAGLICIFV